MATMVSKPHVSVVMPTYNHGRFLKQTISCVLEQTFEDFEIIVVDNGSTDNTKEIVESFEDPRIVYYWQENSGLPANSRNVGIKLAKANYIAFLDSDDLWYRKKLENCIFVLDSNPKIDLVCHDEYVIRNTKKIKEAHYGPFVDNMYDFLLYNGNCLSTSAVVVKKESLFGVGLFSEYENYLTVEDYDLWLKLAKTKCQFYFLHEFLGEYKLHESNESSIIDRHFNNLLAVTTDHLTQRENRGKFSLSKALTREFQIRISMIKNLLNARLYLSSMKNLISLTYKMSESYRKYNLLQRRQPSNKIS